MSEMTTAEMVRSCQEWRCLTIGISQEKRDLLQAIAARLSTLDKDLTAATARAEKAEALYAKAWEECEDARPGGQLWRYGLSKMAHDAARREVGL